MKVDLSHEDDSFSNHLLKMEDSTNSSPGSSGVDMRQQSSFVATQVYEEMNLSIDLPQI